MFTFGSYMALFTDFQTWFIATKQKNGSGIYALRDFNGDSFSQDNQFAGQTYVGKSSVKSTISFTVAISGDGDSALMQHRKNSFLNDLFTSNNVRIGIFSPRLGWRTRRIHMSHWEGPQHSPYLTDDFMEIDIEADLLAGQWESLPARRNLSGRQVTSPGVLTGIFTIPQTSETVYPQVAITVQGPIGAVQIIDENSASVTLPNIGDATYVFVDLDPKRRTVTLDGVVAPWRDNGFATADFAMRPGLTTELTVVVGLAGNGEASFDSEIRVATTSIVGH